MRLLFLIATCLLTGLCRMAPAQIGSLHIGDRVRLMTERSLSPNEWQVGTISRLDTGAAIIGVRSRGIPLESRFDQISRLQRSLGTDKQRGLKSLATGAAIGFVVGAGLTLLSSNADSGNSSDWIDSGLAGTVIGGTAGGIIGFTAEEWSDINVGQPADSPADDTR